MNKIFLLLFTLSSLAAAPQYTLDILGPGHATSINDSGEVAGFHDSMGFFYNDEKGLVIFGEIYKTLPQITNDSKVYFTDRFLSGFIEYETIKPSYWSLETSIVHLDTPNFKVPYWDVSYINSVSKSGNIIIGDHWNPMKSTEQYISYHSIWEKAGIKTYSVNDHGYYCGCISEWVWSSHETSLILTTDCNRISFEYASTVWLTLNEQAFAAGFKVVNGNKKGIHSAFNFDFPDYYFRKLNDNDLAIASSTDDLDTAEYLYDFKERKSFKIADLVDDQSVEILYIFDINTNGDLCGVGIQAGETVAIRLRKVN